VKRNAFAIYHTWPDLRNAEYEVLQRILGAAKNIDKKAVVINNNGTIIWSDPDLRYEKGSSLSPDDVEFAISLHFESPKVCDIYTYYAIWQPVEFYADFGYQQSIDKFSTHDDLMSCHSDIADYHAINVFKGIGRDIPHPLPSLFHALPTPYLKPKIDADSKLFYIGINWERIGRPKGRFHDVLTKLDSQEQIRIYGPESIQGVAPWEGFKTYSGELPFDGASIQGAINECGICLALSSKAHQNSGIMSNRLFEGLASGAAVIANPNALIDKHFQDVVYVVDDSRGESFLEQQIVSRLREIRNDPAAAEARVLKGQQILRDICSLEGSIQTLFEQTEIRRKHQQAALPENTDLSVIMVAPDLKPKDLESKIRELGKQTACSIELHVIVNRDIASKLDIAVNSSVNTLHIHGFDFYSAPKSFDGIEPRPVAVGGLVAAILSTIKTPYFALLGQDDMVMRNHFALLGKAMRVRPEAACAISGSVLRTKDISGQEQRRLQEIRVSDTDSFLLANGTIQSGRILFRSSLINAGQHALLNLLDGDEHYLFLLASLLEGGVTQSNVASYIHDESTPVRFRTPALSSDLQRQFIRDYFNGDQRWKEKTGMAAGRMAVTPTSDPRSPNRWATVHSHRVSAGYLEPNRAAPIKLGGDGLSYLVSGFAFPEENGVWIVEDRGVIEFTLPRHTSVYIEDYSVVLGLLGRRQNSTGRMQHCTFIVNNLAVGYQTVPDFLSKISIRLPLNLMRQTNNFRVEIVPDHREEVYDAAGAIIDGRTLSVLVDSVAVTRESAERIIAIETDKFHSTVEGDPIVSALTAGFYAPERGGTWICGLAGDIQIRLREQISKPVLKLRLSGRAGNADGNPQKATIFVNGREAVSVFLGNSAEIVPIPLLPSDITDILHVSIRAAHAEPALDGSRNIVDPRLLGICIYELGVFEGQGELRPGQSKAARRRVGARLQKFLKG